jgi:hypothetical protein
VASLVVSVAFWRAFGWGVVPEIPLASSLLFELIKGVSVSESEALSAGAILVGVAARVGVGVRALELGSWASLQPENNIAATQNNPIDLTLIISQKNIQLSTLFTFVIKYKKII